MSITLENKQGLIAGDGILPIRMAQYAKENGFEVVCISLAKDNVRELKKYCSKVYNCHPGEVNRIEAILKEEQIKQMTFLGKVHKKVLLQLHKFDKRAIDLIKEAESLSLAIVNENIKPNYVDFNKIKSGIRDKVGKYFYQQTECKPMILIVMQEV